MSLSLQGSISDWHPIYYQWDEIDLPYYVPDTEPARHDMAALYTTISRLDQGQDITQFFSVVRLMNYVFGG